MSERASSGRSDRKGGSDRSDESVGLGGSEGVGKRSMLRPSGGYRALRSFQAATVIYDATVTPACPTCGGIMVLRVARQGNNAGSRFWGCRSFTECKGIRPMDEADRSGR